MKTGREECIEEITRMLEGIGRADYLFKAYKYVKVLEEHDRKHHKQRVN